MERPGFISAGISRIKNSRCTCRSHCTTFNLSTGLYDGEGHDIPRTTRARHMKDDKMRDIRSRTKSFSARLRSSPTPPTAIRPSTTAPHHPLPVHDLPNWIIVIRNEVQLHSEQPVTSPTVPLEFSTSPSTGGPFTWPSPAEIIIPNAGLYSLKTGHMPTVLFWPQSTVCVI